MSQRFGRVAASGLIAVATAIVLLALAVLPFLNPAWVAFEQDRSQAAAWTGYSPAELRTATNGLLLDLVLGPADFDVEVAGAPVLGERERSHMRDVRGAFLGFGLLAFVSLVALVVAHRLQRGSAAFWAPVRAGAIGLVVGIVGLGVVGAVAFDAAFDLFHRMFFAGGSYTFDPSTDRLVQLFPMQFWFETATAVGVVALVLAVALLRLSAAKWRDPAPVAPRGSMPFETGR